MLFFTSASVCSVQKGSVGPWRTVSASAFRTGSSHLGLVTTQAYCLTVWKSELTGWSQRQPRPLLDVSPVSSVPRPCPFCVTKGARAVGTPALRFTARHTLRGKGTVSFSTAVFSLKAFCVKAPLSGEEVG